MNSYALICQRNGDLSSGCQVRYSDMDVLTCFQQCVYERSAKLN